MIRSKNLKFLLLASILLCSACNDFVEVDLPKSQLTAQAVFENYDTANAALTNVYSKIRDNGVLNGSTSGISNQLGNYADELTAYGLPSNPVFTFYNNTVPPASAVILTYWNNSYNQIYAANAVLKGVEKSLNISQNQKRQLLGEALFIRALSHFYLLNLFGDIPYVKDTEYEKNLNVSRLTEEQVYQKIISDLNDALALLPDDYPSSARIRPNKSVCHAFLARVYIYSRMYEEASDEASAVLNKTELYILENDLSKVFLNSSKETIWQLQTSTAGQNAAEGAFFIFQAGPPSMVALTPYLLNSFRNSDLRKANWIKTVTNGNGSWSHAYKYKEQNNTSVSKEYSILFRVSEQYLIRAEARTHQGDLIGAKEDLNKIRRRAGLSDTNAANPQEILSAILQERRWELFTEQGHRFFDLRRFQELDAALSPIKPGWSTTDRLLPVPENELNLNPNLLPQNPGY
ncbi:RagB/SusD family nutrient uptake outer membrane protein [Flavobacterium plurextorum]|uniref:RagB/SusD family nutrient uptake outer membrane protein n=1 Tax=Flavobacterium TaxID=237 RepID=UPI00214D588D|nr:MULTISPECIES: RagB/SusD family nutrient uptake outer membrane protein [Flavobacterium]UUW11248.1 RagB/SusD family nutrient uptake outer membrane protein [Flavobacterium plurextorum]